MTGEPANGSTPWYQTSWPLVTESAVRLRCPVDIVMSYLRADGRHVGPTDRLPFAVVEDAAVRHGYQPEPMMFFR